MRSIPPLNVLSFNKSNVSFIDQSCALQRMIGCFPDDIAPGEAMQFVVNERCQFLQCSLVPMAPRDKELCHLMSSRSHGRFSQTWRNHRWTAIIALVLHR